MLKRTKKSLIAVVFVFSFLEGYAAIPCDSLENTIDDQTMSL